MKTNTEIVTEQDLKSFMQMSIEPVIGQILTIFYELKSNYDKKNDTSIGLNELEMKFNELKNIVCNHSSSNKFIQAYLRAILDFVKRDEIRIGSILSKKTSTDFFELMRDSPDSFNYSYWGIMNQRVQKMYLRIYSYYAKSLYEIISNKIKNDL